MSHGVKLMLIDANGNEVPAKADSSGALLTSGLSSSGGSTDVAGGLIALGLPTNPAGVQAVTALTFAPLTAIAQIQTTLTALSSLSDVIAGNVNTFADLPSALTTLNAIYAVDNSSGVWGVSRKSAGLYRSNGTSWVVLSDFDSIASQISSNSANITLEATRAQAAEALLAPKATTYTKSEVDSITAGLSGGTGSTNSTGPQGIQGIKGDTGLTGLTGAKGDTGVVDPTLLTAEITRATNAEALLTPLTAVSNINNTSDLLKPISNAQSAINATFALNTALIAESNTRATADTTLATNLATETTNRSLAITAEATRAQTAEATAVTTASTDATAKVLIENTRAISAETVLTASISAEVTNRGLAVSAEATRAGNAETLLATNLATETANRIAATSLLAPQSTTYTIAQTDSKIAAVIGVAPAALATLAQIATQLLSDESAAGALTIAVSLKAPSANPVFTGTVSGITKAMIGLGDIPNLAFSGSNTGDQVIPTTLPASDVSAWAKSPTKPAYTYSEVGAQVAGTYATGTGSASGVNTGDQVLPTLTSLGLNNVNNTSDLLKPPSTAQAALNASYALTTSVTAETSRATTAELSKESLSNKGMALGYQGLNALARADYLNAPVYDATKAYIAGDIVRYTDSSVYSAVGSVPANTVWAIGTVGAVWKSLGGSSSVSTSSSLQTVGEYRLFSSSLAPYTGYLRQASTGNLSASYPILSANLASYTVTTTQRVLPASTGWVSVAWNGAVFCAISNSAICATSPDGVSWYQQTMPVSNNWQAISWNGSLFCAICYGSTIYATSPNGVTWTQRALPVSKSYISMACNGTTFCAIAISSTGCVSSLDGLTWTQGVLPSAASWNSIASNGNIFCAVATGSSTCATSPDGITWTTRAMPVMADWTVIAWNGSIFCALAYNSTISATSPDGINWTQRVLPVSLSWSSLAYNGSLFLGISANSANSITSPDGINWTQRALPVSANYQAASGNSTTFCMIAANSTVALSMNAIKVSTFTVNAMTEPSGFQYWVVAG